MEGLPGEAAGPGPAGTAAALRDSGAGVGEGRGSPPAGRRSAGGVAGAAGEGLGGGGDDGPSPVGPPVALNLRPGSALGLRRAFPPRGGRPAGWLPGAASFKAVARCGRLVALGLVPAPVPPSPARVGWPVLEELPVFLGGPLGDIPPALGDSADLVQ